DLAAHVEAGVVVPVELGRGDAVADEHQRHLPQVDARIGMQAFHGDLFAIDEFAHRATDTPLRLYRTGDRAARQRDLLRPAAIVARGLQASRRELLADVGDGAVL